MSETVVDSKVLTRLQKLLAMAKDARTNEHEASAAMDRAQALMAAHNLSMAELEAAGKQAEGGARTKEQNGKAAMYEYQRELMRTIAEANFCAYFQGTEYKPVTVNRGSWDEKTTYRAVKHHVVVGREANVASTRVMFEYLNQTLERLVPISSNAERLSKKAISWKEGCAARLRERINARHREILRADRARAAAQREARAAAAAQPGGTPGTGLVVVLADFASSEADANFEYMYGYEPGTLAKMRAEHAARRAAEKPAEEKPQTEAEKRRQEERSQKAWERWKRQQERKWANKDMDAYNAGRDAAEHISLDQQLDDKGGARKIAAE